MSARQVPEKNIQTAGMTQEIVKVMLRQAQQDFHTNLVEPCIEVLVQFWRFMSEDVNHFAGYCAPDLSVRVRKFALIFRAMGEDVAISNLDWREFMNTFPVELHWYLRWSSADDLLPQMRRVLEMRALLVDE